VRNVDGRRYWRIAVLVLLALGCRQASLPAPDVICRIDGAEIKFGAFQTYVAQNSMESDRALGSDVLSGLLDQYLREELIRRYAVDEEWILEDSDRRESFAVILERLRPSKLDEEAIEEYYQQRREEFERPEQVRLLHLLVEDQNTLEHVKVALREGATFEEIAERYSQGTTMNSADFGGPLARQDLPSAFGDLIFALNEGEVSEVMEAGSAYHIFIPLHEVRDEIAANLIRSRTDRALEELEEAARERYNVRLFERNLPFNYHGSYVSLPAPENP
jgi:hypothetical protein